MLRQTFNKTKKALRDVKNYPWKTNTKRLILETPIEVAIGGVLVSAAFGTVSFNLENAKRGQIPLAFSELSQTVLHHEMIGGQPVPPLTRYYSVTNDVVMQVFEANNIARNTWDWQAHSFAYELEKKVDPSFRVHKLISDYTPRMREWSAAARLSIKPMTDAAQDLAPVVQALDRAWDDRHRDVYRTEYYQETECSGTGKEQSCRLVTKSRQVYDHTVHTYNYNRQQGQLAARLLQDFMQRHPEIRIDERLLMVTSTNAENEWAMRESRRRLPGYEPLKQEDYLRLANTWATGSNYVVHTPKVLEAHRGVAAKTPEWVAAEPRSRDHRRITYTRHDDGPREFQIAEAALEYAVALRRNEGTIRGGIDYADQNMPVLNRKIVDYVNAVLHGGEGNPGKLRREIMQISRDIYAKNYAQGFDTNPAKWGWVAVWAVLGMIAGGGLGLGADALTTYLYQRGGRQKPRPTWQEDLPPRYNWERRTPKI